MPWRAQARIAWMSSPKAFATFSYSAANPSPPAALVTAFSKA